MRSLQRNTTLAMFIIVLGAILLSYALLTPTSGGGGGGGMGGSGSVQTNYLLSNVLLASTGAALCGMGVVLLLPREERYVPPVPIPIVVSRKEEVKADETPVDPIEVGTDNLVLRLLNGDEREMFRYIVEAGGTALQKDIITGLKWSDAKVSRNIDKLEQKGIVTKERSGSTNRIRVELDMEK